MVKILIASMALLIALSLPSFAISWPGLQPKSSTEDVSIVAQAANDVIYSQGYLKAKQEDLTTEVWFWRVVFVLVTLKTLDTINK